MIVSENEPNAFYYFQSIYYINRYYIFIDIIQKISNSSSSLSIHALKRVMRKYILDPRGI